MNREMRRLARKEEERARKRRQEGGPQRRGRERIGPKQYLREVRQELKKVAWPTPEETATFTTVVLVVTVVLTAMIFGMDLAFKRGILALLG